MSGKFNNKTLLVVFIVLGLLFVITRFTSQKKSNRSLQTDIVQIDTSQVSSMLLYPVSEKGSELLFERKGPGWTVSDGAIVASADDRSVLGALVEIQNLKAEQLVARSEDKWEEYQVNDSLGSRIILKEGNKTLLDLVVGRFHYQPAQGGNNMYGQNRGTAKTYIRLTNEEEVYAVEGFLAMSLNQPFERWRDQTILNLNTSQLSRIIYDYPADSGFIAERAEAGWMVAGLLADSASMATFVNQLARKSHIQFEDQFQAVGDPVYTATFEGDNMKPVQVKAYEQPGDELILNSSLNPDSWFRVPREGLFREIFPGSDRLIQGDPEE
jgi:hypothetical protein